MEVTESVGPIRSVMYQIREKIDNVTSRLDAAFAFLAEGTPRSPLEETEEFIADYANFVNTILANRIRELPGILWSHTDFITTAQHNEVIDVVDALIERYNELIRLFDARLDEFEPP